MRNRRIGFLRNATVCCVLAAATIIATATWARRLDAQARAATKVALYAAVGPRLTQYDVDTASGTLTERASVMLSADVQEGWAHPSKPVLYVSWSDRKPGGNQPAGSLHGVTAFTVETSGAIRQLGRSTPLPARSIYLTTDVPGSHLLLAHAEPAMVTVRKLDADGSIGAEVKQPSPLRLGTYPHSVRVAPTNNSVIINARGSRSGETPVINGELDVFTYRDGILANAETVAPSVAPNFQARHLDFHPTRPWLFVTVEGQNKLAVFERDAKGMVSAMPLFVKDTQLKPGAPGATASIHVHPDGRFVYLSNRGRGAEGENSIAVFQIDPNTGEPTRIQNADTRGLSPRTFGIDPSGQVLVAANESAGVIREGTNSRAAPSSLAVFRIAKHGKLEYLRRYDVTAHRDAALFWMGFVPLRSK